MNTLISELQALQITDQQKRFIEKSRNLAEKILLKKEGKKVIILGPCSIHSYEGALLFAHRLLSLQEKLKDRFFLVMRAFIEKPRTKNGWKGFVNDPDLNNSNNLQKGILLARKLFLELTSMNVPIATEFLDPILSVFFEDLITWGFIGARTCHSQIHRQLASKMSFPIGFKNPLDGTSEHAIYATLAARASHNFLYPNTSGMLGITKTTGNPLSHIVLRGGYHGPNYDAQTLKICKQKLIIENLSPTILIDCAHGNCQKSPLLQKKAFEEIPLIADPDIIGAMLECNLMGGYQKMSAPYPLHPGISITDPCLSFDETEDLILKIYQMSSSSSSESSSLRPESNSSWMPTVSSCT